jgi:hypothetical protein
MEQRNLKKEVWTNDLLSMRERDLWTLNKNPRRNRNILKESWSL